MGSPSLTFLSGMGFHDPEELFPLHSPLQDAPPTATGCYCY